MAATKTAEAAKTAPETTDESQTNGPMWTVEDKNCRAKPKNPTGERVHEPVLGHQYRFHPGKQTSMPREHATKFLRAPNFIVRNEAGREQTNIPEQALDQRMHEGELQLEVDETIANLDELKKDALLKRANSLPGGEKLTVKSSVDDIITFLIEQREQTDDAGIGGAVRKAQGDPEDGVTEHMSADEEEALFANAD